MSTPHEIASRLDATNLRLDSRGTDLDQLCAQALEHHFAAVCVYPTAVVRCARRLRGSGVGVATVVGFPSGRMTTTAKEAEIHAAADNGATEVDIVMNYPAWIDGERGPVLDELKKLVRTSKSLGLLSKIIVETCFLPQELAFEAVHLCEEVHADFIKTSTGFGSGGATLEIVRYWADKRRRIRIKASGGIRTLADVRAFIDAGADRIGLSSAAQVMEELSGGGAAEEGDY